MLGLRDLIVQGKLLSCDRQLLRCRPTSQGRSPCWVVCWRHGFKGRTSALPFRYHSLHGWFHDRLRRASFGVKSQDVAPPIQLEESPEHNRRGASLFAL